MKAIVGARRGDLLYLNPANLVLHWGENYCRPEGVDEANIDEMVAQILAPALDEHGMPTGAITGIKEPISVRAVKGEKSGEGAQLFEVIKGFRRATAAQRISKDMPELEVPAIRWAGDDTQRIVDNLTENDSREAISTLGRAAVFGKLAAEHGWSADTIAKALGRAADFVRDHLKLLEAPAELREMVATGGITWANARQALRTAPGEIMATAEAVKDMTLVRARAHVSEAKAIDAEESAEGDESEGKKPKRARKKAAGSVERQISLREWLEQKLAKLLADDDTEANKARAGAYRSVINEILRRAARK